jgi:hypothetical protein
LESTWRYFIYLFVLGLAQDERPADVHMAQGGTITIYGVVADRPQLLLSQQEQQQQSAIHDHENFVSDDFRLVYMGTTLLGLLLSVPHLVSEERSPVPDTC